MVRIVSSVAPIWQTASHTLTNSEIKNLHGTPIQLIAAPGPGLGIMIFGGAVKLNYGGNNAFTAAASQTINIYYNNNTTECWGVSTFISNGFITGTANAFYLPTLVPNTTTTHNVTGVLDNVNVALYNSVATEISGNAANDNTIDVYVIYTIVTF